MNKTLRLSFALKNTYRVNAILYALKQIPLLKKILPDALYSVRGLKIFANILAVIWEILSIFVGQYLYFLLMICGIGGLYTQSPSAQIFLHIFVCLTVIGAWINTSLFNATRDKYYAMILMRMDARTYTLVNYIYALCKMIVGALPFALLFGLQWGVALWVCLLIPFSVVGAKLVVAAISLWDYERRGYAYNENKWNKYVWLGVAILLGVAYGLPAVGILLPTSISVALLVAFVPAGLVCVRKLFTFNQYREINQELLSKLMHQLDEAKQAGKKTSEKIISADPTLTSQRRGFAYLNELFIKRHRKILWKATLKITGVCAALLCIALLALYLEPTYQEVANKLILNWLPYFVFIMYAINRGTGFTRALFMNCDHSLLTYSFYKQPKFVLKLFRIRLIEIMKINAVPALVIGSGLALLLYVSGGTKSPLNYVILVVAILSMSLFFSVHYLTIYYLLQPYNAATEVKSGTYQLVMSGTYLACFFLMKVQMSTLIFGVACIVFCVLYSIVACALVYHFAPKTFRLRT